MFDRLPSDAERREEAARLQRDHHLHNLRILAWCVARGRYSAEPMSVEGGRRGKARIRTFTYYLEQEDFAEANLAVMEILRRNAGRGAGVTPPVADV